MVESSPARVPEAEPDGAPGSGPDSILLHRCPLLAAATGRTDVVCAVHEGMVEGLARAGGDAVEAVLEPFAAGGACRLHLQGAR